MLIQPLLENALHYGAKTSSMPLRVNVSAAVKDDWLEVVVAGSVREARDLLEAKLPDVVFLDVEMPGEVGRQLCCQLVPPPARGGCRLPGGLPLPTDDISSVKHPESLSGSGAV